MNRPPLLLTLVIIAGNAAALGWLAYMMFAAVPWSLLVFAALAVGAGLVHFATGPKERA